MKQLVLVTGANGHVGYGIVKELSSRGYRVRASVRDLSGRKKTAKLEALGAELVEADLLDFDSLLKATSGVDGVFQVAAGYKLHAKDLEKEVRRPALDGTKNILEACARNGVRKIIYTSSIATVGVSHDGRPRSENDWNEDAHEFYAKAKTDAEKLAWKIAEEKGLNLVTILPGAVIGPDFERHTPTTYIFHKILRNQIPMKLDLAFSFIDVRDLAAAHVNAYESPQAGGRYVVCGPMFHLDTVFEIAHEKIPAVRVPTRQVPNFMLSFLPALDYLENFFTGSMRTLTKGVVAEYLTGGRQLLTNARAVRELGLRPRPVEETVVDTLDWVRHHDIKW